MLRIYLARHGQDEDNVNGVLNGRRDKPLTQIGIFQAQTLAFSMIDLGLTFDAVYCSPLKRVRQTARISCDNLGIVKPIVLPDLIERDFGIMTGQPIESIPSLSSDLLVTDTITYFITAEGAETFPSLYNRARRVLAIIRALHSDGSVLLVTHGDIGKMIYAAFYNLEWMKVLSMFHFGNSELLLLEEGLNPEEAHIVKIEQHNL